MIKRSLKEEEVGNTTKPKNPKKLKIKKTKQQTHSFIHIHYTYRYLFINNRIYECK